MALLGSIMALALLPGSTIDSYVEYGDNRNYTQQAHFLIRGE